MDIPVIFPPKTFQSIPHNIHFELIKYLNLSDLISLSRCCQSLRSLYLTFSLSQCHIATNEKIQNTNSLFRTIPLEVFLNPEKYSSWFHPDAVKTIILEGEPTSMLISLLSEPHEYSLLSDYPLLTDITFNIPELINPTNDGFYSEEQLQLISSMIKIVASIKTKRDSISSFVSLIVSQNIFLSELQPANTVTKLHLVNYQHVDPINLSNLRNLKTFLLYPKVELTPIIYTNIFRALSPLPYLEHITVRFFGSSQRNMKTILLLPETIPYCKIELYEDIINKPHAIKYEDLEPLTILQITHLYIKLDSRSMAIESTLPTLELPRLISLESDVNSEYLCYILAKSPEIYYSLFFQWLVDRSIPSNVSCNWSNITILDTGIMGWEWHNEFAFIIQQLPNFIHLKTLSISLNCIAWFYKDLYEYLNYELPPDTLKERHATATAILETFSKIHESFITAAHSSEFMSTITNPDLNDILEEFAEPRFKRVSELLCSEDLYHLSAEDVIDSKKNYFDENIPDHKTNMPEVFSEVEKILNSLSEPSFIEPNIFFEMIFYPEIISILSSGRPLAAQNYFPKLKQFKELNDPNFLPKPPSAHFSAFPDLHFHPILITDPCEWTQLMSFAYISGEGPKSEELISRFSYIFSLYCEREHLMKVISKSLPGLEYLNIYNDVQYFSHSLWLQSVFANHTNLKQITYSQPSKIYQQLDEKMTNIATNLNIDFNDDPGKEYKFISNVTTPLLEDFIYTVKSTNPGNGTDPVNHVKIDLEAFRNKYVQFNGEQHADEFCYGLSSSSKL